MIGAPSRADAVPSFARKYQTSCQTCHVAFPKLTPFGEAFRRNGYRFPEGGDEETTEEDPLALGSDSYKKVWPESVWPGQIPGATPISFGIQTGLNVSKGEAMHGHGSMPVFPSMDHAHGPWAAQYGGTEVALMLGGTMGESFSFFAKIEASGGAHTEIVVERPQLIFRPFDAPVLILKAGGFEPGIHPFSIHRNLTGHDLLFSTVAVGDNGWAPEPEQMGLEASGIFGGGRVGYTLAIVEGGGNEWNRAKDFYGRLEYKLGGIRLDGVGGSEETKPWRDWSLTTALFGYKGFATFYDPLGSGDEQSDHFFRVGGDVNIMAGDVNVILAGFYQHHQRPIFGDPDSGELVGAFAQLDYVLWPWLIPTARYELFRQNLPGEDAKRGHRGLLGVNVLLRANVFVRTVGKVEKNPGDHLSLSGVSVLAGSAF